MEGSRIARTRETRPDTGEILRRGGLPAKSAGTWVKALPRVTGSLKRDAAAATKFWRTGDSLLAKLPKKAPANAGTAIGSGRHSFHMPASPRRFPEKARGRDLSQAYEKLSAFHRVDELAYDVAKLIPGLTPTRKQVDADGALMQSEKDGVEDRPGDFPGTHARAS